MFSTFIRRGIKRKNEDNSQQERIATHIFNTTIKFQHRWATYLQRKTEPLSKAAKIFFLMVFCLIAMSFSLYRVKYSFTVNSDSFVLVGRFVNKGTTDTSADLNFKPLKQPAADDYRRIKRFLNYIDSLSLTPSGKKIKDSILSDRPGLMDSIHHVEKMFQSQSINK